MKVKIFILSITILISAGCVPGQARVNQSVAAANIYHAAAAIEQGVDPAKVLPEIKNQALLIIKTNGDTLKGAPDGD